MPTAPCRLLPKRPAACLSKHRSLLVEFPAVNLPQQAPCFLIPRLSSPAVCRQSAPTVNAGVFVQRLRPREAFVLYSTDPDGVGPLLPTLLLSGNINTDTFITGIGDAGATFNAQGVNYTGGVIYNALIASGGVANGNSMSISMTDVALPFAIAGDGYLRDFTANATGLFNAAVPEPTSFALIAMAFGGLLLRRR